MTSFLYQDLNSPVVHSSLSGLRSLCEAGSLPASLVSVFFLVFSLVFCFWKQSFVSFAGRGVGGSSINWRWSGLPLARRSVYWFSDRTLSMNMHYLDLSEE